LAGWLEEKGDGFPGDFVGKAWEDPFSLFFWLQLLFWLQLFF
jgi:hypothetical protein